jgi:hypothetical protein
LEKKEKKKEITFSEEFMSLCCWIIHAGEISSFGPCSFSDVVDWKNEF